MILRLVAGCLRADAVVVVFLFAMFEVNSKLYIRLVMILCSVG